MKQWYINSMDSKPQDGSLTDFVITVHWTRKATEIINNTEYNASISNSQYFSPENVTNFIPYNELTYDIVCGWLNDAINVEILDTNLDSQIQNEAYPPFVTLPLPFTNP